MSLQTWMIISRILSKIKHKPFVFSCRNFVDKTENRIGDIEYEKSGFTVIWLPAFFVLDSIKWTHIFITEGITRESIYGEILAILPFNDCFCTLYVYFIVYCIMTMYTCIKLCIVYGNMIGNEKLKTFKSEQDAFVRYVIDKYIFFGN